MPSLTQLQAQRVIGGKLRYDHVSGLNAGTPCSLVWVRSALNRPAYLGGRLTHTFDATCTLADASTHRLTLTDRDLIQLAYRKTVQSPVSRL